MPLERRRYPNGDKQMSISPLIFSTIFRPLVHQYSTFAGSASLIKEVNFMQRFFTQIRATMLQNMMRFKWLKTEKYTLIKITN